MSGADNMNQFVSITGADEDTAKFFLGAAQNNVDAAINAFFEADGVRPAGTVGGSGAAPRHSRPAAPAAAPTAAPSAAPSAPGPSRGGPARAGRRPTPQSNFATLGTIGQNEEDDEESGKNYYAGGHKSGQMIQDPRDRDGRRGNPSGNPPGNGNGEPDDMDLAEAILDRARSREHGPSDEDRERFSDTQRFTGAGYRLGAEAGARAAAPDVVGRRNVTRTLTFYSEGFTVDDGPFRRFDDPANAAFLADVNKGVVPREMEEPGIGDVSITLVDKKGEDYVAPKRKVQAFTGSGQTLGSTASAETTAAAAAPPAVESAVGSIDLDETQPIAVVQVRLSDGTRLRARLNDHHTVGQLRAFVRAARPGVRAFTLATTFPKKELEDDKQTVKDAGLKGAVVVQTLK